MTDFYRNTLPDQGVHIQGRLSKCLALKRGYSITHSASSKTVSSINDVEVGEVITTQVEDGVIESQVTTRVAKSEL